jgi:hypothetical protein
MGQSQSINVSKLVTDVIARVATEVVQNVDLSDINSQILTVSDTAGDVTISGNIFTQTARLNVSNMLNSVTSTDAVTKIQSEMEQLAKSLVSGFNILTFTDAKNTADSLVKSTTEILNTVKQQCAASATNVQNITIQRTKGSVRIENNIFNQVSDIISSCTLNSVSQNKVVQDLQFKIDQSSKSELEGFNLAWLAAAVIAIIAIPVYSATRLGTAVLNNLIPIVCFVAGPALIASYYFTGKDVMKAYYYTKEYPSSCAFARKDNTINTKTTSVEKAIDICLNSSTCKVVDCRYTQKGTEADRPIVKKDVPEFNFYETSCLDPPEFQEEPATAYPVSDITAIKESERRSWLLYLGFAFLAGGIVWWLLMSYKTRGPTTPNDVETSMGASSMPGRTVYI